MPVRVRECAPEGLLPQIVYVDLVGLPAPAARSALLAGVRRGRAKTVWAKEMLQSFTSSSEE
ncbi:MAG TPA: hypothetical protein VG148_05685 [Pyrinomonadaceae bacterium]|nr:hypothetical protein [Pyrinomonadaceae bacterium]